MTDATVDLPIDGTFNSRDVSSLTGIRPGVLFRSAALPNLTDKGREQLTELGVTDVVDFRSDPEVESSGEDAVPYGVRVHRLGITAGAKLAGQEDASNAELLAEFMKNLATPGWAEEFMTVTYQHLTTDEDAVKCFGEALNLVADPNKVVLTHCTAGKDRTGVFNALAVAIAGVPDGRAEQDYLYSNNYVDLQVRAVPDLPGLDKEALKPILGVSKAQLLAARRAMHDKFGTLRNFLDAANVSEQAQAAIAGRLAPLTTTGTT